MRDAIGAFVPGEAVRVEGATTGPLAGLRFAAKDLFDVAGRVTGCGSPDWRRSHAPAERHAAAIERLLAAGAELAGVTVTDELAFSLLGRNPHDGTPVNPAAPGRLPGGSSAGSASAVAGGLMDFAVGTDTGGSVRVPAALCGIYGFRPTHGSVPTEGVAPLAPSFDTVGWFARDPVSLGRIGEVLLEADGRSGPPESRLDLLLLEDALAVCDAGVGLRVAEVLGTLRRARLRDLVGGDLGGLDDWAAAFRVLQGREAWAVHGAWIESAKPALAADVAARFAWARTITESDARRAAALRERIAARLGTRLASGVALLLPTAPSIAPRVDVPDRELDEFRARALALTSIAGLARCPQISIPCGRSSDARGDGDGPVGASIVGPRGTDRELLALARSIAPSIRSSQ